MHKSFEKLTIYDHSNSQDTKSVPFEPSPKCTLISKPIIDLFIVFGMIRLGIELITFQSQRGQSTTRPCMNFQHEVAIQTQNLKCVFVCANVLNKATKGIPPCCHASKMTTALLDSIHYGGPLVFNVLPVLFTQRID